MHVQKYACKNHYYRSRGGGSHRSVSCTFSYFLNPPPSFLLLLCIFFFFYSLGNHFHNKNRCFKRYQQRTCWMGSLKIFLLHNNICFVIIRVQFDGKTNKKVQGFRIHIPKKKNLDRPMLDNEFQLRFRSSTTFSRVNAYLLYSVNCFVFIITTSYTVGTFINDPYP